MPRSERYHARTGAPVVAVNDDVLGRRVAIDVVGVPADVAAAHDGGRGVQYGKSQRAGCQRGVFRRGRPRDGLGFLWLLQTAIRAARSEEPGIHNSRRRECGFRVLRCAVHRIDERTRIDLAQCVAGVTVATASTSPLERF